TARVGAPRSRQLDRLIQDRAQLFLHHALHRPSPGLALPAVEAGPVVGHDQLEHAHLTPATGAPPPPASHPPASTPSRPRPAAARRPSPRPPPGRATDSGAPRGRAPH